MLLTVKGYERQVLLLHLHVLILIPTHRQSYYAHRYI